MNVQQAYDAWAAQYDTNHNRTRDLEGVALRSVLAQVPFQTCLEIGCGTGKNTVWLVTQAQHVTAVDLSAEMLAKARTKLAGRPVTVVQADITHTWPFGAGQYDLVTFSLVLEHINDLAPVFREVVAALKPGGHVYVGELHPAKQYVGTKARFDTDNGPQVVTCYTHHASDFVRAAELAGLTLTTLNEFFDNDDRTTLPRILTLVFRKPDAPAQPATNRVAGG